MWTIFNLFLVLNLPFYINPFSAVSNSVESICYDTKSEGISFQTGFLKVDSGQIKISEIRNFEDSLFCYNPDSILDFRKTYWLKLTNRSQLESGQYLLQFHDLIDRIDVFQESDSLQPGYSGGISSTFPERKISGIGYSSAYFKAGKTSVIYARITSTDGVRIKLKTIKVSSFQVFLQIWMRENIIQVFFIGLIFVFFIILFILSGVFRQKYQLFFSLYLLSVCLQWMFIYNLTEFMTGYWHGFELFMNWMIFPAQVFLLLFIREYFEFKSKHPVLHQIAGYILIGQAIFGILAGIMFFIHVASFGLVIVVYDIACSLFGFTALFFIGKNLSFSKKLIFRGIAAMIVSNILFLIPGYFSDWYNGYYFLQISIVLVLLAMVAALALEAFEFMNLFKAQKDTLDRITLKTESLEIEYHLRLSEITEQERLLNSKNIQLAQVSEIIKSLEDENPSIKINHELNKWKEISSYSKQSWQEFDAWFDKSNELFFNKLYLRHPDLSINDRRLCGFLLHDMSTKDIADLLKKSTNTIDVARYRLRHKLGLFANANLTSYLLSIENDTAFHHVQTSDDKQSDSLK